MRLVKLARKKQLYYVLSSYKQISLIMIMLCKSWVIEKVNEKKIEEKSSIIPAFS